MDLPQVQIVEAKLAAGQGQDQGISDIPFDGPCAMTQVGMINGEFIINPSNEQKSVSDLALTVASTREKVIMIAGQPHRGMLRQDGRIRTRLQARVESHFIDYSELKADNFNGYFIDRAKSLLNLIEKAMNKPVTDRDAENTLEQFGASLA